MAAPQRADPQPWLLGVSRTLLEPLWNWPVHGLRHPPAHGTSGWYIWVGELSTDADFFVPIHAEHLIAHVPEIQKHLLRPPGSRFLLAPGYADAWQDDSLLDSTDR